MRDVALILGWALIVGGAVGGIWLKALNVQHRPPDRTVLQSIALPYWVGNFGNRLGACAVAFVVGITLVFGLVK
jgi:hypothetical protein